MKFLLDVLSCPQSFLVLTKFSSLIVALCRMQRVEEDGDWSLFCPNEAPGLSDTHSEEFKVGYGTPMMLSHPLQDGENMGLI